jgi:hypothetical protein
MAAGGYNEAPDPNRHMPDLGARPNSFESPYLSSASKYKASFAGKTEF